MSVLSDDSVRRLDRIDWNFPNTGTAPGSVHTLHWFPGNFIPQIPAALIQVLSAPRALVLDPFVGSGTTAVEALRQGRRVIASDRMSACVMITRAKLAFIGGAVDRRRRLALLGRAHVRAPMPHRPDRSCGRGRQSRPGRLVRTRDARAAPLPLAAGRGGRLPCRACSPPGHLL